MGNVQATILPNLPELTFMESGHIYRLNKIVIPSVSAIMRPLITAVYSTVSEETLNRAANRGQQIHSAIERFLVDGVDYDIAPEYGKYFEAFKHWYYHAAPGTTKSIEVYGVECRIYHRVMRYAGTVDLLCNINGKLHLIDFKSSSKIENMLVRVQMSAYAKAFESHGIKVDKKQVVHLKKDGAVSVVDLPLVDTESWDVFGSLLNVYSFLKNN
jgi:hypothetical protein